MGLHTVPAHSRRSLEVSGDARRPRPPRELCSVSGRLPGCLTAQISCWAWNVTSPGTSGPSLAKKPPGRQMTRVPAGHRQWTGSRGLPTCLRRSLPMPCRGAPAGPPCRVTVTVPQSLVTPASRLASPRCLTACAVKGPGLGPLPEGSAALKVLSVWPLPRHENKFTRRTTSPEARTSCLRTPRPPSALDPDPGPPGAAPEPALHSPGPLLQLPQAGWGRSLGHPNWNPLPGPQAGG